MKTILLSLAMMATGYSAVYTGRLDNDGGMLGGASLTNTLVNANSSVTYSYSDTDASGGILTFDFTITRYTGSSFLGGVITHGSTTAISVDQHFLTGNNAAIGGNSFTVDIGNLAYDNTLSSFTTPTLAFGGFSEISEFGAGSPDMAIGTTSSATFLSGENGTTTLSTPVSSFALYVDSIAGASSRYRNLDFTITLPDATAVPEPSAALLLCLGGLSFFIRRRRV